MGLNHMQNTEYILKQNCQNLFILSFLNLTQLHEMVYDVPLDIICTLETFLDFGCTPLRCEFVKLWNSQISFVESKQIAKKVQIRFLCLDFKVNERKDFSGSFTCKFFFVSKIGFTYNLNLAASEEMLLHKHASETIKRLQ